MWRQLFVGSVEAVCAESQRLAPAEAIAKGFKVREDHAENNQQEKGELSMKRSTGMAVGLLLLLGYVS
jgi:hypothetical protein